MDEKTVKMDLRRIKYGKKHIAELEASYEKQLEYLKYLRGCRKSKEIKERIAIGEETVKVKIAEIKRKSTEIEVIEARYRSAIRSLSELDQRILREGYIGGTPYWKIGEQLGYSERGIQERMVRIFEAIASLI